MWLYINSFRFLFISITLYTDVTAQKGCSICGKEKVVSSPDVTFLFPVSKHKHIVRCGELDKAGKEGLISFETCQSIGAAVEEICGCVSAEENIEVNKSPDQSSYTVPISTLKSGIRMVENSKKTTVESSRILQLENSVIGTCGDGSVGNTICADGNCCSQFGYCGNSPDHCASSLSSHKVLGTCGGGSVGNNFCADGGCCSEYGYCGTSPEHCGTTPRQPVPVAPPNPSNTIGTCGGGSVGNKICADGGCCSYYGHCGTSPAHCGTTPTQSKQTTSNTIDTCGGGSIGNNICADGGCCSQYGYCGNSLEHCGTASVSPNNTSTTTIGTCGGGSVGDNICADGGCCSQWGFCGIGPTYCATPSPTQTPPPFPPTAPISATEDSRMIAFLANWLSCPSEAQWSQYSHIMISFAVAYVWQGDGPKCTDGCYIPTPMTCDNRHNEALIEAWHDAGKKVLLSFGGAGMGGSWAAPGNGCWEGCFGKEDYVVDQLVNHVNELKLDGIDFDYEYYYENNQRNSSFNKGPEAQRFIRKVTEGLKAKLPSESLITHAPMDIDLVEGTSYYNILEDIAEENIDFLMPQYYNHITNPPLDGLNGTAAGRANTLSHYNNLVDNLFQGDARRLVFGLCIEGCNSYNADSDSSIGVMSELMDYHPCNGGVFFWQVEHDTNGDWSRSVNEVVQRNAGCSNAEIYAPSQSPTKFLPTKMPIIISPTRNPLEIPTKKSHAGKKDSKKSGEKNSKKLTKKSSKKGAKKRGKK